MILEAYERKEGKDGKVAELPINKLSDRKLERVLRIQALLGRRVVFALEEEHGEKEGQGT